ncbi:MAG: sterol desaturase family protein [Anaerolineae bacterium]
MAPLPTETSRNAESMRIFESDFLEFFTHISPVTIVVMWVPVAAALLYVAAQSVPTATIVLGVLIGLFAWTFVEYMLHRFLFHYEPRTPRQEKIFFLFHGIHHAQPQDKTRLVMPLPVSIPLGILFYGLFYVFFVSFLGAPNWLNPVMAGFVIGYLIYDLTHYATHHFPMRSRLAKYLKRHHMIHHYKEPNARFGVSTPFWDWVFGTMGRSQ